MRGREGGGAASPSSTRPNAIQQCMHSQCAERAARVRDARPVRPVRTRRQEPAAPVSRGTGPGHHAHGRGAARRAAGAARRVLRPQAVQGAEAAAAETRQVSGEGGRRAPKGQFGL